MRHRFLWVLGLSVFLGLLAANARGQYMYLDTNGDAIHDDRDELTSYTSSIDVFLNTSHRRDGSLAVCSTSPSSFTINSYEVIFHISSGTLTYGTWTDAMFMSVSFGSARNSTDLYVGLGSLTIRAPGVYKLGTLTVSGVTANTVIGIASSTPLSAVYMTAFGSNCEGFDFDNTLKLGTDWFDTDGLASGCTSTNPNNSQPNLEAPATASGAEGTSIAIQASASDPDAGSDLLVTVSGAPFSLTLTGYSGLSPLSPVLSGTLGYREAGTYALKWRVRDGQCAFDTTTTILTVGGVDQPPILDAPTTATGTEGVHLYVSVYASDADGDAITNLSASGLPDGATFNTDSNLSSGTFSWTPGYSQAGTYTLAFAASNALTTTAATVLTIANSDRSPVVVVPSTLTTPEGSEVTFLITATDPDGEEVPYLDVSGIPVGAVLSVAPNDQGWIFAWTPGPDQAGTYFIVFTARNNLSGTATTRITVTNVDHPPVLTFPGDQVVDEGVRLSFMVSVSDPDGQTLSSFSCSPRPPGSSFYPSYPYASGEFYWTPSFRQSGEYSATFTAYNTLSVSGTVNITVREVNQLPILSAPNAVYVAEGTSIAFDVFAPDADGEPVTIDVLNRPVGATFYDLGNARGLFQWTPSYGQAGMYVVTFTARDVRGDAAAPKSTTIEVDNLNRSPAASIGGPYSGVIGVAIEFDGTESSDPDGDALQYLWDYGDGLAGAGATPSHAYIAGGRFTVTLSVSDGFASAFDATTATVQDVFPAHAFTTNANATIRLGSGKAIWCTQVEPADDAYLNTAIIPSSISMSHAASTILAQPDKLSIGGDKDGNGTEELTACFTKTDLRVLFADLPNGTNTVTVVLEGDLATGGKFRTNLTVNVVGRNQALAASIAPNPVSQQGVLTFETTRLGRVTVSVFDLQGRLVRRVLNEGSVSTGYHDVVVDGRREDGARLPSGVYFYRVEADEGVATGRFALTK